MRKAYGKKSIAVAQPGVLLREKCAQQSCALSAALAVHSPAVHNTQNHCQEAARNLASVVKRGGPLHCN